MDKELIERIALEVADSITAPFISDESMTRFAHRFLARIDAERGKGAVAWKLYFRETLYGITDQEMVAVRFGERFSTLGKVVPLFLSQTPTIPEGWALYAIPAGRNSTGKGRKEQKNG